MYQEFIASHQARKQYWSMKREVWRDMSRAEPNVVHEFLAEAEMNVNLAGVITQNIDGLHQLGGSRKVLELHGTNREAECIDCHWRCPICAQDSRGA